MFPGTTLLRVGVKQNWLKEMSNYDAIAAGPQLTPWGTLKLGRPFRIALNRGKGLDPCVPPPFPSSNKIMCETYKMWYKSERD